MGDALNIAGAANGYVLFRTAAPGYISRTRRPRRHSEAESDPLVIWLRELGEMQHAGVLHAADPRDAARSRRPINAWTAGPDEPR